MPRLTLQPDNDRIWVTLDEQRIVSLRGGDCEGLKVITTWLVDSQTISAEEAAAVQSVGSLVVRVVSPTSGVWYNRRKVLEVMLC